MHNLSSTDDEKVHAQLRRLYSYAYALTNLHWIEQPMGFTTRWTSLSTSFTPNSSNNGKSRSSKLVTVPYVRRYISLSGDLSHVY